MPERCPMASGSPISAGSTSRARICTCSLSRSPRSLAVVGYADFCFDVPRPVFWPQPALSWQPGIEMLRVALTGYTCPPDQPPEQ